MKHHGVHASIKFRGIEVQPYLPGKTFLETSSPTGLSYILMYTIP